MAASRPLPAEMQSVQARALRALRDARPANAQTQALADFWSKAQRTEAGHRLPEYYLVYFLLVELLEFPHQGPEEKVAWTIPLDFRGTLFTFEHRKMGLGLFHPEPDRVAADATEIVNRIHKATKEAQPFFDWLADTQVAQSAMNVANHSQPLYERYRYLRQLAQRHFVAMEQRKAKRRGCGRQDRFIGRARTLDGGPVLRTPARLVGAVGGGSLIFLDRACADPPGDLAGPHHHRR